MSEGKNRRTNIRFRDPDNTVVNLYIKEGTNEIPLKGLIVNESFKGMAFICVGNIDLSYGAEIFWIEAENIITECEVIRCKEVEESVYSLAIKIKE
jgi:hypothetical protein